MKVFNHHPIKWIFIPKDVMNENRNNKKSTPDAALWADELHLAITVSDMDDTIMYMNEKAKRAYPNAKVGDQLASCHKQVSMDKIDAFKKKDVSNIYTVQRNGIRKFIHQTPWYKDGIVAGLVEFSIEIPTDISHIDRD